MKIFLCILICSGLWLWASPSTRMGTTNSVLAATTKADPSSTNQEKTPETRKKKVKKCQLRLNGTEYDNGDHEKVNKGLSYKKWYKKKDGTECTKVTVKKGYHFTVKGIHWSDGTYEKLSEVVDLDGTSGEVSKEICEGD